MAIAASVMSNVRDGTGRDDWQTPQSLVNLVEQVGPIELDPCAGPDTRLGWENIREPDDGLKLPWRNETIAYDDGAICYVNPPYSQMKAWVHRACAEHEAADTPILLLCAARPDTRWWRELVEAGSAVCFLHGRLKFVGATSSAPFPSAVWCLAGPAITGRFVEVFREVGWCVARGGW